MGRTARPILRANIVPDIVHLADIETSQRSGYASTFIWPIEGKDLYARRSEEESYLQDQSQFEPAQRSTAELTRILSWFPSAFVNTARTLQASQLTLQEDQVLDIALVVSSIRM